jgi:CTP synthase
VASQFHPELKSRAIEPHPLFKHFVKAALQYKMPRLEVPVAADEAEPQS